MKRIVSHKSQKEHYKADACIIWCFDARFSELLDKFIKQKGFVHVDMIYVAGGAKDLASPENESAREYVLGQISKSVTLHHTELVIPMVHMACGAYGASGIKFDNQAREAEFLEKEALRAKSVIRNHLGSNSTVKIENVFADFDGLHEL